MEVWEWVKHVEDIGGAAGWNEKVMAKMASTNLVIKSPAYLWYNCQTAGTVDKWPDFKTQILARFSPIVGSGEKIDILKSFVQNRDETVTTYFHRVHLGCEKFNKGLTSHFNVPAFANDPQDKLDYRDQVLKHANQYQMGAFFLMGLREDIQEDVTKSGALSLEDVLAAAQRCEHATATRKKHMKISAVDSWAGAAALPAQPQASGPAPSVEGSVVAALNKYFKSNKSGKSNNQPNQKNKDRPRGEVWCYYCLLKGHYANECTTRINDREAGRYRATVRDQFMSKDAFLKLSPAERNKGRELVEAMKNNSAAAVQPAPANNNPFVSADAVHAPRSLSEQDYNNYFGKN